MSFKATVMTVALFVMAVNLIGARHKIIVVLQTVFRYNVKSKENKGIGMAEGRRQEERTCQRRRYC